LFTKCLLLIWRKIAHNTDNPNMYIENMIKSDDNH